MKNYEFNNWIEAVKAAFPKFNPTSEMQLAGWKEALGDATLDEAKAAVVRYIAENSSRYEPQPKEIREILKAIKSQRPLAYQSPGELVEDMPERRFHEDIALGRCRHNLYCYRDAAVLVKSGEATDFDEGLRLSCRKRTAARGEQPRDFEFPSDEDLQAAGLKGVKAKSGDCKRILESFIRQWSMPR